MSGPRLIPVDPATVTCTRGGPAVSEKRRFFARVWEPGTKPALHLSQWTGPLGKPSRVARLGVLPPETEPVEFLWTAHGVARGFQIPI